MHAETALNSGILINDENNGSIKKDELKSIEESREGK